MSYQPLTIVPKKLLEVTRSYGTVSVVGMPTPVIAPASVLVGADGSKIYQGSSAPLSADGKNGDIYINTTSYDLYQKASGSWSIIGNVRGPASGLGAPLAIPLLINGGFELWGSSTGPFSATGLILPGCRFTLGTGSTNALQQIAGITEASQYALRWNRSVAGTGTSTLDFRFEDAYSLANQTVTAAFDAVADTSMQMYLQALINCGTGGSGTLSSALKVVTATSSIGRLSSQLTFPSLAGKTVGPGSYSYFRIGRSPGYANGSLDIDNLILHPGTVDMGTLRIDRAIERMIVDRQSQNGGFQAINGSQYVGFCPRMRAAPTVTVSVGTASNITQYGFTHTHTASAAATFTASADL